MDQNEAVLFLQWGLPRLKMRWKGFSKVKKQVLKKIKRRMQALNLSLLSEYKHYLETHTVEWKVLDPLCTITISRFYRDKYIFKTLEQEIIPYLLEKNDNNKIRCLSIGCASGEEPYTLAMQFDHIKQDLGGSNEIEIKATEINPHMLERTREGFYKKASLKDLPEYYIKKYFKDNNGIYQIDPKFISNISFFQQDIRQEQPAGPFHLILCRYLVFTYYDIVLQAAILKRITYNLQQNGFLIIGSTEELPKDSGLEKYKGQRGIYKITD